MKSEMRILLCGLAVLASLSRCLAHDNFHVHPAISASAAQSSYGLQSFLAECFDSTDLSKPPLSYSDPDGASGSKSPLEWVKEGSKYEDITRYENIPSLRGQNHFYDPIHKIGLTDGIDLWARSSFRWATENLGSVGGVSYPWPAARAFELSALTNSSSAERETKLAQMLFYLGHVIHLNQDLTVPAHVRNDNHWASALLHIMWTEKYGEKTYYKNANNGDPDAMARAFPQRPRGWSWWQNTAGFQKLEDFWDGDRLRANGVSALNNDAANIGRIPLGLAEFSNGNFISEDATYKECTNSSKHYFAFPSLDGTTYSEVRIKKLDNVLLQSIHPVILNNGDVVHQIYLEKKRDGIRVIRHCALSYLGPALAQKGGTPRLSTLVPVQRVSISLNDSNVLQEYHEKLIPKAVEYSAGVLDYFFRGTFTYLVSGDDLESYFTLQNISGQDFSGGSFVLLIETNGVRTIAQQYPLADILPNGIFPNNSITNLTYAGAVTNKYLLFYQGTIGWTNGAALDPVDAGIAIAIGIKTNWHSSFEGGVNSEPTNGDYFADGWHVDSGSVDLAVNGIWGQQAYDGNFLLDLDGLNPGTISTIIPTVTGQSYQLNLVYSRNPDGLTGLNGEYPTNNNPSAEILINTNMLLATINYAVSNDWSHLQWQQTSYAFTASSPFTTLTFKSLDTNSPFGILLDDLSLKP